MPDLLKTNRDHAKRVAPLVKATPDPAGSALGGIWHWINGVANGISHFFGGSVTSGFRAVLGAFEEEIDLWQKAWGAYFRIITWYDRFLWHTVVGWLLKLRNRAHAELMTQVRRLIRLIYVTTNTVLNVCMHAIRKERADRVRAVNRAEAKARREIKAMHQTIEREAASGYRVDQEDRVNLILRLLDFAVLRNPEVGALVKDMAGGILDLLTVDDPLARLLLGFLIKQVIDRLGIDKAVGALADDLLAPILGKPKPHDIHDVVLDLSDRMLAVEKQWTQFFTEGGSQVEQAGREWRDITSVAGTIAIVGFTAEAMRNPQGWATAINDIIGKAANDVAAKAVSLFEGA